MCRTLGAVPQGYYAWVKKARLKMTQIESASRQHEQDRCQQFQDERTKALDEREREMIKKQKRIS
jgi:hypothetical protein